MIDDNKSAVPRQVNIDNLTAIDDTPSEDRTAPQRNKHFSASSCICSGTGGQNTTCLRDGYIYARR